ncbi:MAG: hypothetical protein BWY26_00237 [Elusimicrobia bacterium ADurb.Bin231]|nr:MAG: hypothetical protein BWY26_00237 [Elusimicrobia bacterium ADurb.Bin231]
MSTPIKLKIKDNSELRDKICSLYAMTDQISLAKWALSIAKRILCVSGIDYKNVDSLAEGFKVNELWQKGKAKIHDVRKAGFKIHKFARVCDSEIKKSAFRTAGQAVASGHMKEHAIIASDYAVKTIGLITKNDILSITEERKWQFNKLNKLKDKTSGREL